MGAKVSSPLWRPSPFKEYTPQALRAEIENIQSQSKSIMSGKKVRIVICACGRDGKSSTINNILSALEGTFANTASIGGGTEHVTQKYIEYKMLIDGLGKADDTLYVLCDTPGIQGANPNVEAAAIKAAIDGKFRTRDTVDYTKLTEEDIGEMKILQEKAACVIFVIAATKVILTKEKDDGEMESSAGYVTLKSVLEYALYNDIKTACLITKCDKQEDDVGKDMRYIYYSKSIETTRRVIQRSFRGFPEERIFPIVNYTKTLKTNANMMIQTLFALKHIMDDIHSNLKRRVSEDHTADL